MQSCPTTHGVARETGREGRARQNQSYMIASTYNLAVKGNHGYRHDEFLFKYMAKGQQLLCWPSGNPGIWKNSVFCFRPQRVVAGGRKQKASKDSVQFTWTQRSECVVSVFTLHNSFRVASLYRLPYVSSRPPWCMQRGYLHLRICSKGFLYQCRHCMPSGTQ